MITKRITKFIQKVFHIQPKPEKYVPDRYWKKRHKKFGFDLRGVGNRSLTAEQNEEAYRGARDIFLSLCQREGVDFENSKTLDIGCGTGYYADAVRSQGCKQYLGIDITDQLFPVLRQKYPDYTFRKADISSVELNEHFDLIIMIDVTQHIVDESAFSSAMKNVASCLSDGGIFVVTSWLSKTFQRRMYYEVERPMEYYTRAFPESIISEPVVFRDKFIFTIRKR